MPMAKIQSAMKRNRQNEKKKEYNKHYRTTMKTQIKKLLSLVENKKKDEAKEALKTTVSVIDKVRIKGIIHRNNASRKIARLSKLVDSLK
jgi:small subunit ribosomal protein S20